MLSFPDLNFSPPDLERLADWVELNCFVLSKSEISVGDIAEHLHSSMLLDDPDEEGETQKDETRNVAEEIVALVRRRGSLADGYPFLVSGDIVQNRTNWTDSLCFATLLIADMSRFYGRATPAIGTARFAFLFEKIAQSCLSARFLSNAVRFGWPIEPGWPKPIADRVRQLAIELGLEADDPSSKTDPKDKDIGLDVVVRMSIFGDGPGTGVLLAQCATGQNWETKKDEPYMSQWMRLVHWHSHLIPAAIFPWRQDNPRKFRQLCGRFPGLVFDRMRLTRGSNCDAALSVSIRAELTAWCQKRISEFAASA